MPHHERIARAIRASLPCYGLVVAKADANYLATMYGDLRPHTCADALAAKMAGVASLVWLADDDDETKQVVMRSLIHGLDMRYFVATFEHDWQVGEKPGSA